MGETILCQLLSSGEILSKSQHEVCSTCFLPEHHSLQYFYISLFRLISTHPNSTICLTALLPSDVGNLPAGGADAWLQLKAYLPLQGLSCYPAAQAVGVAIMGSFT